MFVLLNLFFAILMNNCFISILLCCDIYISISLEIREQMYSKYVSIKDSKYLQKHSNSAAQKLHTDRYTVQIFASYFKILT